MGCFRVTARNNCFRRGREERIGAGPSSTPERCEKGCRTAGHDSIIRTNVLESNEKMSTVSTVLGPNSLPRLRYAPQRRCYSRPSPRGRGVVLRIENSAFGRMDAGGGFVAVGTVMETVV